MRLILFHKEDFQQNQWADQDLDCCPGSLWRSSVRKGGMQQVVVATILVLAPCHPQARLIDQVQSLLTAIVQSACQLFCQRNVCSHNWNQVKVTVCTQMHGLVSFANIQAFVLLKEVMELIRNTFETMIKGLYILCSSRSSFVVMEAVMVVSDGFVSWAPATPRHLLCSRHLPWKSCLPQISKAIIIFFISLGRVLIFYILLSSRVAELGSLSSGAKMAMKISVKRVFAIFASNASFLRGIANLQN